MENEIIDAYDEFSSHLRALKHDMVCWKDKLKNEHEISYEEAYTIVIHSRERERNYKDENRSLFGRILNKLRVDIIYPGFYPELYDLVLCIMRITKKDILTFDDIDKILSEGEKGKLYQTYFKDNFTKLAEFKSKNPDFIKRLHDKDLYNEESLLKYRAIPPFGNIDLDEKAEEVETEEAKL